MSSDSEARPPKPLPLILARELASVRLSLDGMVTREDLHDALTRLERLIVDRRPAPEA